MAPRAISLWWLWVPSVVWMGVIFASSSMPIGDQIGLDFPLADKLAHTAEYAVLGLLLARLVGRQGAPAPAAVIAATAALTLGYGVTDEIHQIFVPTRHFDLLDMTADLLGGLLGGIGWVLGSRISRLERWL